VKYVIVKMALKVVNQKLQLILKKIMVYFTDVLNIIIVILIQNLLKFN